MRIARQGYSLIFPAFIIFAGMLAWYLVEGNDIPFFLAIASGILSFFLLFFFRDPERRIPSAGRLIISPADGKVIAVDSNIPNYMAGYSSRISIFLTILDVHVNRAPMGGRVTRVEYHKGKFSPAFTEKASSQNEHTVIELENALGKVGFCQRAGTLARRIICNLQEDQEVKIGERFGMIRFGSRVDLYLPDNISILTSKGRSVKGGESILAEFKESET